MNMRDEQLNGIRNQPDFKPSDSAPNTGHCFKVISGDHRRSFFGISVW